jgi:protein TonB
MAESVARRDRIDPPVVTNWYQWEVAGKPVSVYLSFDVIDRLEHETLETFRSLTSRGSEMGGILLGSIVPGNPAVINIEDYATIACDYTRGPLYRLSEADLRRFEKAIEEHSAPGPIQVVGFFRSHTRKGLVLDAEDLQFLSARFRSPHSVALLIRPFATRASVAGILLRDESGFNSDASALEFPFRSAQLAVSKREPEAAAPSGPVRAQVVPIASRREVPPPAPALPPPAMEPRATLHPETTAQPGPFHPEPLVAEAVLTPQPAPSPIADEPGEPPAAQPEPPVSALVAASPVVEPAPVVSRAPAAPLFGSADPALLIQPSPASKVPLLVGLLAAALLAFVLLFVYPGFLTHRQGTPTTASQDSSPLTLRIEHTGTDLLLTWNRDSAAIRNASRAALSISDGERHEKYDMDLGQLQTGSIVYSPMGGDVSFQMEVIQKNGSHTATETLRVLRTRPSPMPDQTQQAKSDKPGNGPSTPSGPEGAPAPADPSNPGSISPGQEPVRAPTPVKPFDTSSLAARLRPAQAADLADMPRPAGDTVAPRINTEAALPFGAAPAIPAPVAPTSSSGARGAAKTDAAVGGHIQAAQLISRREPEYSALARQMGARGLVELMATVGTDGSVKAVKVISGHPLLVKAAQDAVMHWRYRPTMLNGVPVENDTRITLNFIPQQ